jgi:putative flippase GtrA
MSKLFNLLSTNKFIGFLFIGSFNTMLCLILYAVLLKLGMHYIIATTVTFVFGVIEGYALNSFLVFKTKPHFRALIKFAMVYLISLMLNLTFMYAQVEWLNIDKLMAQIITSIILAGVNFYLIKIFVYRIRSNVSYPQTNS